MSATGKPLQPIIIKRIKKTAHGAHGGAWKIAYADFVTAMMALFLLLWLLGATTDEQRGGIADHFNVPIMVALFGDPAAGAATILPGGGADLLRPEAPLTPPDDPAQQPPQIVIHEQQLRQAQLALDRQRIENLRGQIEQAIAANPQLAEYGEQIRLEMVQDGLYIQIVDELNRPMFGTGSPVVEPHLRSILRQIAVSMGTVENRISISGHTDAAPFGRGALGYSNWELSADRANASRRELMAAGLPETKIARVVGMGPSQPLLPEEPLDPRNRRISILVLTQEAEDRMTRAIEGVAPAAPAPPDAAPDATRQGATPGAVNLPPLPNLLPPMGAR
ncbi:flagellar motor protein [Serpentinimonas maccroryi]|uniref:Flagellar motor protein n=1 Tax=Serpentinimonas maccroryi TaxID=1458426 RepID=A0A060NST2_9BURK|nr:flagellar motor protein MotB [Serpentinimonas maccroryi]BAO82603.1 flagellar motor protein [Serpentinimonas maccroryi]